MKRYLEVTKIKTQETTPDAEDSQVIPCASVTTTPPYQAQLQECVVCEDVTEIIPPPSPPLSMPPLSLSDTSLASLLASPLALPS